MGTVRVFHCDDSDAFRLLVREVLSDAPGIELVGQAASARATLERVAACRPDVVLLDLRGDDLEPGTVGRVHAAVPEARIVVLTGWQGAVEAEPIHARLSKDHALDELVPTIRRVAGLA